MTPEAPAQTAAPASASKQQAAPAPTQPAKSTNAQAQAKRPPAPATSSVGQSQTPPAASIGRPRVVAPVPFVPSAVGDD
jgi:hypothetical protein